MILCRGEALLVKISYKEGIIKCVCVCVCVCACVCIYVCVCLVGHVQLFATPWTIRLVCPWRFSRQEYWSGLPFPSPGDLPNPGIEPRSPALHADSLPSEPPGNQIKYLINTKWYSIYFLSTLMPKSL